jgi:hypothetical protein
MIPRWAALVFVLALGALVPRHASAQGASLPVPGKSRAGLYLGPPNYPNPSTSETKIPFTVGDSTCSDPTRHYKVSLRIYNLLTELVAVPVLQNGTITLSGGQPLEGVQLTCGRYTAYWNGTSGLDKHPVSPGLYLYRLEVDGQADVKKMMIQVK